MLKAGFVSLFLFVWIIGMFLGSTFELHDSTATWGGSGTGGYAQSPITTLDYLTNLNNVTQRTELLGTFPMVTVNTEYFKTAVNVFLWRFAFLYNPDGTMAFGMVYWVFFFPFVAMGILSFILLSYNVIRGNFSF